jgi:hypothetical protein
VLLSNASLHLQAAAAEEAAAAAEWQQQQQQGAHGDPVQQGQQAEQQGQQKQMFMLRAARQPKLPAVVTQLSSVRELLDEVAAGVHGELQELFRQHTWVGMVSVSLHFDKHRAGGVKVSRAYAAVCTSCKLSGLQLAAVPACALFYLLVLLNVLPQDTVCHAGTITCPAPCRQIIGWRCCSTANAQLDLMLLLLGVYQTALHPAMLLAGR